MDEPRRRNLNTAAWRARLAAPDDHAGIVACVRAAYAPYVQRIGKEPAPMLADYRALIAAGHVRVVGAPDDIRAVLVSELRADHIFIENVAVRPDQQGTGLGTWLLRLAEEDARRLRAPELRLYTHELMTENLSYYVRRGFVEVGRRVEDGYARVYFRKPVTASGRRATASGWQ
jgi:ribosomal protein S18 acetylase RimI-like enzyme